MHPCYRKVFDPNVSMSTKARNLYDRRWVIINLGIKLLSNLTYSEALHIILAKYQSEPLSLKFAAMKKILVLDLEVKDLPEVLQVKAEKGLFTTSDQIRPFISEKGKKILEEVKRKFEENDSEMIWSVYDMYI